MPKAILFDLDQTLLDRNTSLIKFVEWQVNFFQLVPQQNKQDFIARFIELDNNGNVWKDLVYSQLLEDFNIKSFNVETLLESYVNDFNKFSSSFERVPETIQNLYNKGYKLGLVSNGKSPFQENNFYALGINEFFSTIIVSEAIGIRKPDRRIFEYACKELGYIPNECIFVGDNPKADIEGAHKAGMKTIFFHPDPSICSPLPDKKINHYDQLETAINKLESFIL
ncbi:HAD family hydrolase [Acinetobacter calcoaceticus]|uniref:Hydrolase of the HAD superfamily n=1 Tax=Acinetobacter calcoaceticus TaxID=471 RepID=A0ABD5AK85_ACICA|nr:HAD family hydrolase [Acinetobacter calcoaceticus]MDP9802985.1 putative hydrolase of the HAD superfamily [Acinetobacter calcoaceticus]